MTIWNRVGALRRDHGSSAKALGAASLKLAAASRAASDVRLRISISLFTINFTIFVVGFVPTFAMFDGKWLMPVLGPKIVWDCMWTLAAPGLFLAISPTDRRIIYGICCFIVPFCLFWGATFTSFFFWIAAAGFGPESSVRSGRSPSAPVCAPGALLRLLQLPRRPLAHHAAAEAVPALGVIRVLYGGAPRLRGASSSACLRSRMANDPTGSARSSR